jgi:hypothetical protein
MDLSLLDNIDHKLVFVKTLSTPTNAPINASNKLADNVPINAVNNASNKLADNRSINASNKSVNNASNKSVNNTINESVVCGPINTNILYEMYCSNDYVVDIPECIIRKYKGFAELFVGGDNSAKVSFTSTVIYDLLDLITYPQLFPFNELEIERMCELLIAMNHFGIPDHLQRVIDRVSIDVLYIPYKYTISIKKIIDKFIRDNREELFNVEVTGLSKY